MLYYWIMKKATTLSVEEELLKEFQITAIQSGSKYWEAVEEAMRDYIRKHQEKGM